MHVWYTYLFFLLLPCEKNVLGPCMYDIERKKKGISNGFDQAVWGFFLLLSFLNTLPSQVSLQPTDPTMMITTSMMMDN